MDSKTRAKLRGLASTINASVIIGKEGVTQNVVAQISTELDSRELVKITILPDELDRKQILDNLAKILGAEAICMVGKKIVLYRYSTKKKVKHVLSVD